MLLSPVANPGKIVAADPRMRGMDNPVLFFYYHAKLGPEFIRKLYGESDVTIARDYRQTVDWLGSGKFSLCIPCVSDEMDRAMQQGLPVGQIPRLKEGGTLSSSGGTLSLLQNTPHPNAAKGFVNLAFVPRRANASPERPKGTHSHGIELPQSRHSQKRRA